MKNSDGSLYFGAGIDAAGLQADAERIKREFKNIGATAESEGSRIDNVFKKIGMAAAGVFTIQAATSFISKIAQVRGEFQQLEVAFTTILKSKDKADKLMAEAVKLAAITPFTLQDVATGAKQLLAYGFGADSITKNLTMLGNIASGVSAPLGDIVYLYGTLQTQGRAYTRDILQFTSRGIPMIDELSKVMGVSKDKVQGLVEAGKIGFPQVEKAMQNMTKEGGMFFNLMEEQSKTITGKISNLSDAFSRMYNDMGKSSEGIISGVLDKTIDLVNNYQEVGRTLAGLIVAYGTYKAAIIALNVVSVIQREIAVQQMLANIGNTGATIQLTTAQGLQAVAASTASKAQLALNASVLANPYVLAAAAVAALAYGIYKYATYTTDAEKAQKKLEEATTDYNASLLTEQVQIETLFAKLKNAKKGTEEYDQAKSAIMNKYGTYLKGLGDETTALNDVALAYKTITEEATKASKARAMQGFADQAAQDYGKTMSGLMDDLKKEVEKKYSDPKQAAKVMVALTPVLAGNEKRKTLNPIISKFDVIGGGEMTGLNLNPIIDLIEQSGEARKILNGVISDATAIFGEAPKEAVKGTTEVIKDYNTQLKEAQTNLKSLKQKQSDLEKHKVPSKDYAADIEANIKELAEAQKTLDTLLNKPSSKETKATDSQAKAAEESLKADLEFQKRKEEIQFDTRQAEINNLTNANNKALQQSQLDHDKKILEINRQESDLLALLKENAQKEYEAKGGKGKFDTSKVELPKEVSTAYSGQRSAADTEQRLTIYNRLLEEVRQKNEERKKLSDEANNYEVSSQAEAIREMAKISKADLSEYMKRIKAKIDLLKLEGQNVKELEDAYKQAAEALKQPIPTKFEKLDVVIQNLSQSVAFLGQTMQQSGGAMGEMGAIISTLANSYQDLSVAIKLSLKAKKESLTEEEKGQMASSAINAISNIYSMIANQIAENKKAQQDWNDTIQAGVQKARLMRIENDAYKEANIFGVENPYAKAIAGAKQYATSMTELQSASAALEGGQVQTGTEKKVSGKNVATGAAAGAVIGSVIPGIGNLVGAAVGAGIGAMVGALTRKTVPVFESLKSQYGEIYNKDTFELNPKILEDYDKLDESTKQLVDNWGEIKDKAKAAQDEMSQNFKDLAGDIGTQLSDALVNAFKNGDVYGAMTDFHKYMTGIIENIISQMIFAKTMQPFFDELDKRMNASFAAGGDNNITDDLEWFYRAVQGGFDKYNSAMTSAQAGSKGTGFELFQGGGSNQQGAASQGSFQTMSRDTGNALEGRFTSMQMTMVDMKSLLSGIAPDTAAIKLNTSITAETMANMKSIALESMNHLYDINKNTKELYAMRTLLEGIKKGTDQI